MHDEEGADARPIDARILAVYDELTASERRLASVVMEERNSLSSFTAGELAARANISNATAARFFRRLGYNSYNDAKPVRQAIEGDERRRPVSLPGRDLGKGFTGRR